MADPTITIAQNPGIVSVGEEVILTATIAPAPPTTDVYTYAWVRPDGSETASTSNSLTVPKAQEGAVYSVSAVLGTNTPLNAKHSLVIKSKDSVLIFSESFSFFVMAAVAVGAGILLFPLFLEVWHTKADDDVTAIDRMVVLTTLGLLSIGAVVIAFGVYGGLMDVRSKLRSRTDLEVLGVIPREPGRTPLILQILRAIWNFILSRFTTVQTQQQTEDEPATTPTQIGLPGAVTGEALKGVAAVVDSIGKLAGASLILVIGCVPLVAAAWVAQTAVDNQTMATPTPSASASATGSPTATDTGTTPTTTVTPTPS